MKIFLSILTICMLMSCVTKKSDKQASKQSLEDFSCPFELTGRGVILNSEKNILEDVRDLIGDSLLGRELFEIGCEGGTSIYGYHIYLDSLSNLIKIDNKSFCEKIIMEKLLNYLYSLEFSIEKEKNKQCYYLSISFGHQLNGVRIYRRGDTIFEGRD